MERAATRGDDMRIALRDAAASGLVAALGFAAVLVGAPRRRDSRGSA